MLIIYSISFILNILITFCISQFNNSPIKTIIVLVISYLASMCIIASIGTFDYKKILIGAGIEFIIINVLFGITIKMNIKVNKDEYHNNILNEQIVIYRNEIATKNRYNQKIKSIEHDINNHIISIRNMISDNRNNEAVRYIDEVFNILNNHDNILDTGNIEIDSIMNTKLDEMASYGITYCHNIMIPCGMNINAMSIVIILGNLLDNSIEAVRKIKESEGYQKVQNEDINIEIIYDRGTLNINVSNITYRNKENLFYNIEYNGLSLPSGFNTSKDNADKHGIGISNIIHIVQQNNGLMSMSRKNGIFTTKITLFI
ncbi:MAG: GHKL domain-containing protein [Clostridiales bacterium]|nr:GHKL domain-containing protein [Clostridiales bacterium]